MQRAALDLAVVGELPITWHSTTPQRFECQPGCVCCCVHTLFFPSEAAVLPASVAAHLSRRRGLIRPLWRPPGVCWFFDERAPWHCQIPRYRPLRCRLYPYLPLITGERIVIVADPFCTVSWPETDHPAWFRCYGLGQGSGIVPGVEAMSREFLRRLVAETPDLAGDHLWVQDVDAVINWKEVGKHRDPLFPAWDTELIRRATKVEDLASASLPG